MKFTYFKASGEFYTSGSFDTDIPFYELTRAVREGSILLPGLQSGRWDEGPILIVYRDVPHLLLTPSKGGRHV